MNRRRRRRPPPAEVPWLAIAAAARADGPGRGRRRRRRRPAGLLLLALLLAVAVIAGVGALTPGARPPRTGRRAAARVATHPTTSEPGRGGVDRIHRGSARASDPFTPALRRWLAARPGEITAAVQDLRGGRIWLYHPGRAEDTASIVKVDILVTLLHEQQDDGGLTAAQRALAAGMIEDSDDTDASVLWAQAGGAPAVQALDRSIGMSQTTPNVAWGLTRTTPRDQLRLLRTALLDNRLLTPASRAYASSLMHAVIPYDTWGVSEGPDGDGGAVALKNGWLPNPVLWQVNSIGSVSGAGRRYLIAVMTSGDPTWADGRETIAGISRASWADLDGVARPAA